MWVISVAVMIAAILLVKAYARMADDKDAEETYMEYLRYKERQNGRPDQKE